MPGGPRKPTEIHAIQGTLQKCRVKSQKRNLEPKVEQGLPDAPEGISIGAAQEWGRSMSTPWLKYTDEPMFFAYCVQRDQINRAVRNGEQVAPAAWTAYRSACQSLGFDPPNRARMQVPEVEKPVSVYAAL